MNISFVFTIDVIVLSEMKLSINIYPDIIFTVPALHRFVVQMFYYT